MATGAAIEEEEDDDLLVVVEDDKNPTPKTTEQLVEWLKKMLANHPLGLRPSSNPPKIKWTEINPMNLLRKKLIRK